MNTTLLSSLVALSLGALALLAPSSARPCDCAGGTPATYVKGADTIFFGRSQASTFDSVGKQTYDVLLGIKHKGGTLGATFERKLPKQGLSNCDERHKAGQYVLLFVRKGDVSSCDGNAPLEYLLTHGMDIFLGQDAGKALRTKPDLEAFKLAFEATLKPYLHKRKTIHVVFPPLSGKRFTVDKTGFVFVKKAPAKKKPVVMVAKALQRKGVVFIDARFDAEGLSLQTISGPKLAGKPAVIWAKKVAER